MAAQLQLFEAQERTARWTVRVSRRARRMSVRVYPGGRVEVVVPPGAAPAVVQRFVGSHRQWIERRVEDLSAASPLALEHRPQSIDLPAIERTYSVEYRRTASTRITVTRSGERVLVVSGAIDTDHAVEYALQQWLAALAQETLYAALSAVAGQGGFPFKRIQIRRQRTRWGSCSASGTISLNVCLLFLDPAVVRYLLVHELCHTKQMNHSPRFWALVARHEPRYEQLDRELLRGWQRVPGWMFG